MLKHNSQVIAIFLISIIGYLRLEAQESPVRFQNVGNLEDYSSAIINCIFQDSRGLIWFGTDSGLDRWDGNKIVSYPDDPSWGNDWPYWGIHSITEDDKNNLWFASAGSLYKFSLVSESCTNISRGNVVSRSGINCLKYSSPGIIWLGSSQGLFGYFPDQDSTVEIRVNGEPGLSGGVVTIDFDTTGLMWVAQTDGLYCYDSKDGTLKRQIFHYPGSSARSLYCADMNMDKDGSFWIVTEQSELLKLNPYTRTIDIIKEGSSVLTSYNYHKVGEVQVDKQNNVWYRLKDGLLKYDPGTGVTCEITNSGNQLIVGDLFMDSHGNILLATMDGVKIIDSRAANIKRFDISHDSHTGAERWITEIVRNGQTFWIGTDGSGLIKYNAETGELTNIRREISGANLFPNAIRNILRDRYDRIWVHAGEELQCYDSSEGNLKLSQYDIGFYPIISDDEGIFWGCNPSNIVRFDPVTLETSIYPLNDSLYIMSFADKYPPMCMTSEGMLWFMGSDAITKINPINGKWIQFGLTYSSPLSIDWYPEDYASYNMYKSISYFLYDSKNRIWVGTNRGLYMIDTFPGSDSIAWNSKFPEYAKFGHITSIIEDAAGNIWVGSYTGIYVIMPNGHFSKYTYKDGLPESPRVIRSLNADPNGSVYVGNIDFVEILPDFLKPNETIPPVLLTELSLKGTRIYPGEKSPLRKSIILADRIDLKHDQNFFRIDFSALNYEHPERNQYRYRLIGVDVDTIHAMGRSYAEYTDLAPGNYTFWVTGSNNTGLWNPKGTSIIIKIHPPWHRSLLAMIIYFIMFVSLVLGYIRIRTSRLKKETIRLESEVESRTREVQEKNKQILELDGLKTRFFNNISHEFRTLVTMIKAPAETIMEEEKISRKGSKGLEVIYRNTNRLMNLVNQLLDISRIDKHRLKLNLQQGNIFDFAYSIAVSFAALAETKGIQYKYYLPRTDSLEWFDADKLEKVLNNLLSNAFKFTEEGGRIRLDMVLRNHNDGMENILEISVSDTGIGIPENEQVKIFDRFYQAEALLRKEGGGAGIGLSLTRDLVDLMHGTIQLESQQGKGSTFKVKIPLGLDHLKEEEYTISEELKDEARADIPLISDAHQEKASEVIEEGDVLRPLLLVVEDNSDILWLLASKLGRHFRVLEAVDGSAGWKLATEEMPDLIITDLMMPRMDGTELCRKLKNDIRTSHIPVIMLTAKATGEDKLAGLETGADDYLTKPFEIKELLARSKNLVEQRRKLRERFSQEITLNPRDIVITSTDEKFLNHAMEVIERHMSNEHFDVAGLCEEMNMSRSTLFRKLDALTNQSPVEFIRTLRLKRAAVLLKEKYGNVSEVALEVGFNNPSYFSKIFKKVFKVSPVEYVKLQST